MYDEDESQLLEFDPINDHCNYAKDKEIKKIITTEKFLFSDDIYKKNKFGFNQTRQLILTDLALYNLKSKKSQRRLDISKLKGITVSIAKLEAAYEKLRGRELDFIYTDSASLKNRMTTKSEKKSDPKFSRMDDSELCDIKEFFKHLYYKNYDDKNERELIYIDKIDEEEINPIIERENLIPLIRDEKKKVVDTLKMSVAPNKKIRTSLANVLLSNDDKDKEKEAELLQDDLYDIDDQFYEEDDDEEVALKPAKYEDFEFGCCIGKGKISNTYIAKSSKYGVYYAVKVIDKEKALLSKTLESFKVEKKILTSLVSLNKCVVVMVNCFQTFDKIFFTYPFYREGDLLSFMEKRGGTLRKDENLIFFYVCQLVIFLIKMHENNIIYRNLKPENIIIESKGNLKMTDFSKSKIITFDGDKGLSLVGAPEYLAPEVILGIGQKYEVDWWCLGILIYQMVYGYTPFYDEYIDKIYQKILYTKVAFDSDIEINKNLKSLIKGLLQKDLTKRIKDSDIQNHPYFTEGHKVDWNKVANFEIECPMKPEVNEEMDDDIQNFDAEFTQEKYNDKEIKSGDVLEYIKSADSIGSFDYFN